MRNTELTTGDQMYDLVSRLYPICRSITGEGVRETLKILQEYIPLSIHEVPTGEKVFDWEVPREWNISDAWVRDSHGNRVIEFQNSNLHVLSYSIPIHRKMFFSELKEHLYSMPNHPEWIPNRTAYYKEDWGFCLSQNQFEQLDPEAEYEVFIDSSLEEGSLTYGELFLPGESQEEVFFSSHCCHPSLANDNLSGIAVMTVLAQWLNQDPKPRAAGHTPQNRYSYRFLFAPATIGALTWLSRNEEKLERIRHGLVVSCVGDTGPFNYKRTRSGQLEIDQVVGHALAHSRGEHNLLDFSPDGYDERQYASPGFDLPVGRLTRSCLGDYPEYHTSADNLDLVRPQALAESLELFQEIVSLLEGNQIYLNLSPKGEPQLGRRGLYSSIGGMRDKDEFKTALLWVLNLSDGDYSLLEIADRAELRFPIVRRAADALLEHRLLGKKECQ